MVLPQNFEVLHSGFLNLRKVFYQTSLCIIEFINADFVQWFSCFKRLNACNLYTSQGCNYQKAIETPSVREFLMSRCMILLWDILNSKGRKQVQKTTREANWVTSSRVRIEMHTSQISVAQKSKMDLTANGR